jgi:DNA segregation ATPase FtsK/SpoIIIE, S-DNA-T family
MNIPFLTRFPRLREVGGLLCVIAAVAFATALATYSAADPSWDTATRLHPPHNQMGRVGALLSDLCFQGFGLAAWLFPAMILWLGWRWMRNRELEAPLWRMSGFLAIASTIATAFTLWMPWNPYKGSFEVGGVAGFVLNDILTAWLNPLGASLFLLAVMIVALYLVSTFSLSAALDTAEVRWTAWREKRAVAEEIADAPVERSKPARAPAPIVYEPAMPAAAQYVEEPVPPVEDSVPWVEEDIPIRTLEEAEAEPDAEPLHTLPDKKKSKKTEPVKTAYTLPPTRLMNPPSEKEGYDSLELKDVATRIKAKLEEFNVLGNVVQINPGPVVTTFEFKPDAGVKIAKITTLSEDLCLGLQAESILIERIPGKPTVGIEVPNSRREVISLRQIIESDDFQEAPSRLTFALGKDISGRIRITELEKMPHLLIAGSTGSGKSVMLNTMIMSILYKSTPDEVRMIMVDPKRVELGIYDGIPHLLTPVITDAKKAVNALRNAVIEMERRLKLLASYGVRNIDQFNKKVRTLREKPMTLFPDPEEPVLPEEKPLPCILIVIDELADLMMLERAGVEESVIRLAQMARAVGIHLVLATQRPSVDVITGLIKANFPARVSFRVATRVDSRTVLDVMGAEHLLGKGDMLFLPPGTSRLLRVHGALITEIEITAVVEHWKGQAVPEYDQTFLLAPPDDDEEAEAFDGEEDPLYRDAVKVVLEMGKASTSILQRRLRLGYGRAARILDMMQHEGIIGPPDGSRPRDVLKRPDWLDEVETALR